MSQRKVPADTSGRQRLRSALNIYTRHKSVGRQNQSRDGFSVNGSHAGSHQGAQSWQQPHVAGLEQSPDLHERIVLDTPGRPPDVLLIRGFGVRVPGGAPRLTCTFT